VVSDKSLLEYLDNHESSMIAMLETLVNIDSGSYDKPGIDQVIQLMKEYYDQLGFLTEIIDLPERGNHLVARKPGHSNRKLLFLGHCDTVFEMGTASLRSFRVEGNRAYGPGVADMKGGLTVMAYALRAVKEKYPDIWDDINFTVVINSDEEISSLTSREIIEEESRSTNAICVLEPARAGGEYVTQRKGHGTFRIQVTGKGAHSGVAPEQGASAVHELCHKVLAIQALSKPDYSLTVNIGVIHGGTRPNVIADFAKAEIDVRITSEEQGDQITKTINDIASEPGIPGTRTKVRGKIEFPPMVRTKASLRLFKMVQLAGEELGLELDHIDTGGASDGSYASKYAPTCDGMGPQGGGYHSLDEYIELPTLLERTKVLARFVTIWHSAEAN